MKLLFSTSNKPGAALIRLLTWSEWSHVGLIDESTNEVIEAVYPKVRAAPLPEVVSSHTKNCIVEYKGLDDAKIIAAARSQIGKPYDLKGVIGLGFNRDWQDTTDWWCSELVLWAAQHGGFLPYRPDILHRVKPQELWALNPDFWRSS